MKFKQVALCTTLAGVLAIPFGINEVVSKASAKEIETSPLSQELIVPNAASTGAENSQAQEIIVPTASVKEEVDASQDTVMAVENEAPMIMPYDAILISNAGHTGTSAYENSFTLSPSNGKSLNVWVKNNNSSKTVYFQVTRTDNGQDFGAIALGPGQQDTRNFTMNDNSGMQGKWKVYVYTKDGHNMNINVSARQF